VFHCSWTGGTSSITAARPILRIKAMARLPVAPGGAEISSRRVLAPRPG